MEGFLESLVGEANPIPYKPPHWIAIIRLSLSLMWTRGWGMGWDFIQSSTSLHSTSMKIYNEVLLLLFPYYFLCWCYIAEVMFLMLCQILRIILLPFTILEFPCHRDAQFYSRSVHCIMGGLVRLMLHEPTLKIPLLQYFIWACISGHDNHLFLLLVHFIRGGIVGFLPNQIEASRENKEPSHT